MIWLELVNAYGERLLVPAAWCRIIGRLPDGFAGKSVIES